MKKLATCQIVEQVVQISALNLGKYCSWRGGREDLPVYVALLSLGVHKRISGSGAYESELSKLTTLRASLPGRVAHFIFPRYLRHERSNINLMHFTHTHARTDTHIHRKTHGYDAGTLARLLAKIKPQGLSFSSAHTRTHIYTRTLTFTHRYLWNFALYIDSQILLNFQS